MHAIHTLKEKKKNIVSLLVVGLLLVALLSSLLLARAQASSPPAYNGHIAFLDWDVEDDSISASLATTAADGSNKTIVDQDIIDGEEAMLIATAQYSPDGTKLAYTKTTDQGLNIAVFDVKAGTIAVITNQAGCATNPQWSGDSQTVFYASQTNCFADPEWKVYSSPVAGGAQTLVTEKLSATDIFLPTYSVSQTTPKVLFQYYDVDAEESQLITVNQDGTGEQTIFVGESPDRLVYPTFSPNSQTILYFKSSNGVSGELYTINVNGTNQQQITDTSEAVGAYGPGYSSSIPYFSPDGTKVSFAILEDGESFTDSLGVVDVNGTNQVLLDFDVGNFRGAIWSPDSSTLASSATVDSEQGIFTMTSSLTNISRTVPVAALATGYTWQPLTIPPTSTQPNPTLTYEGSPVSYNVPAQTTDVYGTVNPSSVIITEEPGKGAAVVDPATGVITYTPDTTASASFLSTVSSFLFPKVSAQSSNSDQYTYQVCSGSSSQLCTTNTVTIAGVPGAAGSLANTGQNVLPITIAALTLMTVGAGVVIRKKLHRV